MKKLTISAVLVFVIGTVLAVLFLKGNEGTIIDSFTYLNPKNGMHYFFSVAAKNNGRQTVEVTEAVYNAHGYGDIYNPLWTIHGGYSATDLEPVGNDQGGKPH